MRTRSQARISVPEPPVRQPSVESSNLEKPDNPPIVTMADNRTMAQLLEAPTEGYEDAKAAAANFNQANSGYRPPMVSNQIRPPGFPPVQNPHANSQNNFNRGNNFNQNRGNNFNQGQIYRPPVNQPVAHQPVAHQGPAPQTHGVSKTDFERYVTANDAVLRNMQNQASTSGSGTLPGNTVTNPKEDLKGITTRSGVTIQGPKAVNHDTEVTKDTMPPANNGSTEDVQPPVVQIQSRNPNPEPNVAPVVTPVPKASIPFPSRRNDERRKEKANDQIEKFYEIFRILFFEIALPMRECSCLNFHALIDVYEGEITLRVSKEAITFNLDQTSKYTADYNHMTDYKRYASGNPTPYSEPIVSTASPTLTPFGDSDFLLFEEADSFLALEDDQNFSEERTQLCEDEKPLNLPLMNLSRFELKELPPHLEYAFLEGDNKLPVIIATELKR
ncbi:hypothetical protein Tco_0265616 [Tanacetum coccineum]